MNKGSVPDQAQRFLFASGAWFSIGTTVVLGQGSWNEREALGCSAQRLSRSVRLPLRWLLARPWRLYGSRRSRAWGWRAWGRGCCRPRRWWRPYAWPWRAPDRDARCGLFWRRCTSSAWTSKRFPRLSPRTGRVWDALGRPNELLLLLRKVSAEILRALRTQRSEE